MVEGAADSVAGDRRRCDDVTADAMAAADRALATAAVEQRPWSVRAPGGEQVATGDSLEDAALARMAGDAGPARVPA